MNVIGEGRPSRIDGAFDGAYPGPRAAALSGVPKSTVYYWARKRVVVPSISSQREMFWSYADLVALRVVYWLRQQKQLEEQIVRATPMDEVRKALVEVGRRGLDLWSDGPDTARKSTLVVDMSGKVHIDAEDRLQDTDGQSLLGRPFCRLLGPFDAGPMRGPDLVHPRPKVRIVPGRLCGEPHVATSRVSTLTLYALEMRGLAIEHIAGLYPTISADAIGQALDLEHQLARNILIAA